MLFIQGLSKSCGMEVYSVEKLNVWMEVALRTPKWPNDDSKFVEFLSFHILLTPVWLVFILQYFSIPVFMTESILVKPGFHWIVTRSWNRTIQACFD